MNELYDLVIIGGGPAGVAAGVYAARKRLKTALVTTSFGGQSIDSQDIQNWIGTPSISGFDLAQNLKKHLQTYAGDIVTIHEGEKVISVTGSIGNFTVTTQSGKTLLAKTTPHL